MTENATTAGYVISVTGSKISAILAKINGTQSGEDMTRLSRAVQIGALVKVHTPRTIAFGVVSGLAIHDLSSPPELGDRRVIDIDLFGEALKAEDANGGLVFQRGISTYPCLGDPIYAATSDELAQIYACPQEENVPFGTLHQDSTLPTHLVTDKLLGKHFAILGTTGSGKSCALAVILRSLLASYPAGHIVLLDPHNEYSKAFGDQAEVITPDTLQLPYWLLNFEELTEVLCSAAGLSREAEVTVLKEAIIDAKRSFLGSEASADYLTVDTPVPYRLTGLVQSIDEAMGKLDKPDQTGPYRRLRARIEGLRADRRYSFMFSGLSVRDTMADVLSHILRIPVSGKPVTIFDLSGVPSEIVDVVVSLLCRTIFDFALWSGRGEGVPLLLVCEEAHRYIPREQNTGFGPTRQAISQIAKEGRKYGVSLCLVSQRPSELSESILSQCNTLFALRMSNEQDQDYVRRALPESAAGMLSSLPALRNQEAVVIGEGVSLPMRIRFNDLSENHRPRSDTAVFSSAWKQESAQTDLVALTIDRWRRQTR